MCENTSFVVSVFPEPVPYNGFKYRKVAISFA